MSKDAYYFSHDSNAKDDPKCVLLIEQLGLEGYGIFWVLIETLRDQPEYKYPLLLIPALARRFNTTTEKMKAVVYNYSLFQIENDQFFFSQSLLDRMIPMEQNRLKRSLAGKKGNEIRWGNSQKEIAFQSQCDRKTSQSKVKESKEDKSKEEYIKEEYKEPFFDWIEYKKSRRETYKSEKSKQACYNKLVNLSGGNPEIAKQIVEQSMANNWAGLFELKNYIKPCENKPYVKPIILHYNGVRMEWPSNDIENGKNVFSQKYGGFDTNHIQVL